MQERKRIGTKEEPALFICIGRQVLHMSESYSIEGCPWASLFSVIRNMVLAETISAAAEQENQKQPAAISAAKASASIIVSTADSVISATAA